jgi:glycosyltransferase involved in cell wall biosynthesis
VQSAAGWQIEQHLSARAALRPRGYPGTKQGRLPDVTTAAPPSLSIIVPVYNEARTVASVLERLLSIGFPVSVEVLVVDDGSTDGTGEVLDNILPRPGVLRVIHADRNGGKGAAIRLGLANATGSILAIQDADLELDPAQLVALVTPIIEGKADVVYGSRFMHGGSPAPLVTVVANRFLTSVTNLLFGGRLTDMETCYKIMRTDIARSLGLESNRFDIEPEITAKLLLHGYRIHELPVSFTPRQRSEGKKINWRDGIHAVRVLLRHRFARRPTSHR